MDEPPFALVCGWRYPLLIIAKGGSFSTVSTLRLYSSTSLACGFLYEQKLQYPVRILESLVGAGGRREPRYEFSLVTKQKPQRTCIR